MTTKQCPYCNSTNVVKWTQGQHQFLCTRCNSVIATRKLEIKNQQTMSEGASGVKEL